MRAIGPGSVASLLKIALDCAYGVLWLALAAVVVVMIGTMIALPFIQTASHGVITLDGHRQDIGLYLRRWPAFEGLLFTGALYVGVLIVITNRLRRVFETLTQGDPFRPENVGRLHVVGLGLIALEVVGYFAFMAAMWLAPEWRDDLHLSINLSGWFAILAVFVLAEVFREGARLRSDAELTI
jgi:succinate-acetate transporter protein